jgi:hypothetical protein
MLSLQGREPANNLERGRPKMNDINTTQKKVLKKISDGKPWETTKFDLRTINALVRRDFAKLTENKKGQFVKVTAKGKKALN